MTIDWPLMEDNITDDDINVLVDFLQQKPKPRLTQGEQVKAFEEEWSEWLGVKHSVYVNSGASANYITMRILRFCGLNGHVIVPTLTWPSDIGAVIQNGFSPLFVDIEPNNLCMDTTKVIDICNALPDRVKAVFLTHVQGFNGLTRKLVGLLNELDIPLIEDCCEAHGATFDYQKVGTFGSISNFSFYFAHHMTTIEGGMICTNDDKTYEIAKMLRSHGMVRETSKESAIRLSYEHKIADVNQLSEDFIFAYPSFNFRGTELGAVIGRNQLKRLDKNNEKRQRNLTWFLSNLNINKYKIAFDTTGNSNYAFPLILQKADMQFRDRLEEAMKKENVVYRRGSSGGGNQLRQPYLSSVKWNKFDYPNVEHVHHYGWYIGNYPSLTKERIIKLCAFLNGIE